MIVELIVSHDPRALGPGPAIAFEALTNVPGFPLLSARVWFETKDTRRVINQVLLAPWNLDQFSPSGIDWRALRALPLGQIQREADELLAGSESRLPADLVQGFRNRPGRRGRSDLEYARIAADYVQRQSSRSPVRDLADAMHR